MSFERPRFGGAVFFGDADASGLFPPHRSMFRELLFRRSGVRMRMVVPLSIVHCAMRVWRG